CARYDVYYWYFDVW
nr:immunoglobulin heavy chain junction region [Mus musculus]